jgi:hypothetical protein
MPKAGLPGNCSHSLLKEPSAARFQLIASALLCALFVVALVSWNRLDVIAWPESKLVIAVQVTLVIALLIPAHELVHAAFYPRRKSETVILGYWPKMGSFYAGYTGELSRNRLLSVYVSPFVVLTLLPLTYAFFADEMSSWIGLVSILNAGFSGADLYVAVLLLRQVPSSARVKNDGWRTYWRHP